MKPEYAVVPVEPTEEMLEADYKAVMDAIHSSMGQELTPKLMSRIGFKAILSAAPSTNMVAISKDELEALRADAERYRWLRGKVCIVDKAGFISGDRYAAFEILDMPWPTYVAPKPGIEFDRAIDAALQQNQG